MSVLKRDVGEGVADFVELGARSRCRSVLAEHAQNSGVFRLDAQERRVVCTEWVVCLAKEV